jgi:hypothetical protein
MMNEDMELLRDYVVRQSEQAFEMLVARHVNLESESERVNPGIVTA